MDAFDAGQIRLSLSELFPEPDKIRFAQSVRVGNASGPGESRIRWYNQTDDEPIGIEVSDTSTAVNKWSGWMDYDPQNPDTTIGFNVQGANDSGNDCQIDNTNLYIGIQL